MKITNLILSNNLYPQDIQTYVQPFNDGSQFFWNKIPCYTEFINDENGRLQQFFKSIREQIPLQKDSIYFEHQTYTQDVQKIRNSDFFKRLTNTYLFSRTYDRTILSTDSKSTFYFCFKEPTQQILNTFSKISGRFLFVFQDTKTQKFIIDNKIKRKKIDGFQLLYNYEPKQNYDLFSIGV